MGSEFWEGGTVWAQSEDHGADADPQGPLCTGNLAGIGPGVECTVYNHEEGAEYRMLFGSGFVVLASLY